MQWIRTNWVPLITVFLIILPSIIYLNRLSIQSYVEYFVPNANGVHTLLFAWSETNFGQNSSNSLWRLFPVTGYYEFFRLLGIPANVSQAIFLASIRLIGFFGFIAFIKLLYGNRKLNRDAVYLTALVFVYNLYTLNYFSGSYIILLPYFLMPVQLYLLIKAFTSKTRFNAISFALLLSIVNCLFFGINLVFDVISVIAMCIIALFYLLQREVRLRRVLLVMASMLVVTVLLIIWWILPMLSASTSDAETSNFILGSESFYNLETSPINLLRGLGEWGFFSGYRGEPYHSFSSWYHNNIFAIASSLVLISLFIYALYLVGNDTSKRVKYLLVTVSSFIILLLPFIGGTNKAWPTAGIMQWAFSSIPYFMALRNTYKWMSLVMLLECIIVGYALHILYTGKYSERVRKWLPVSLIFFACLSTIPLWTGNVYEKASIITKLPNYWTAAIEYMNTNETSQDDRTFLLPNQYFSVYEWEGRRVTFPASLEASVFKTPIVQNTCKGCGQYNTANMIDFIYGDLQAQNLSKLLGFINVTSVIQRNDYNSAYYDVETPDEVKAIAEQQNLQLRKQFGKIDIYDLPKGSVYPRVYSPKTVIETTSLSSSLDIFDEYDTVNERAAFAVKDKTPKSSLRDKTSTDFYSRTFDTDDNTFTQDKVTATVDVPASAEYGVDRKVRDSQSSFKISYIYDNNGYRVKFVNIDGDVTINGKPSLTRADTASETSAFIAYERQPVAVKISDRSYYLTPTSEEQQLPSMSLPTDSDVQLTAYRVDRTSSNLLPNPSFEDGAWNKRVSNCSQTTASADISSEIITNDKTQGDKALKLHASADSACMFSSTATGFKAGDTYLLSFDYKNVTGAPPAYCVWDGKGCAVYSSTKAGSGWQTENRVISTTEDNKQFIIYIYAPKNNYAATDAIFDNFRVTRLSDTVATQTIRLTDTYSKKNTVRVEDNKAEVQATLVRGSSNLINNGSFEQGLWNAKAGNCQEASTQSIVKQAQSNENTEGERSIKLTATKALACVSSSSIKEFQKNDNYLLSFDYKVTSGESALYCIWNGQECIKKVTLPANDRRWQNYTVGFNSGEASKSLSVYLYAQAKEGKTEILYDNISIEQIENKVLNSYSIKKAGSSAMEPLQLSYKRHDPTHYTINIKELRKGIVVLQESYQPLWKVELVATSPDGTKTTWQVPKDAHKLINGYANAWVIDPDNMPEAFKVGDPVDLVASFTPQQYFYKGLYISAATLIACIGFFIFKNWRLKPTIKKDRSLYRART